MELKFELHKLYISYNGVLTGISSTSSIMSNRFVKILLSSAVVLSFFLIAMCLKPANILISLPMSETFDA